MGNEQKQAQATQRPPVPAFKDVYQKGFAYPGKRVKVEDIVGKEILIREFTRRPSKFQEGREMAVIYAQNKQVNPEQPYDFSFATGSKVVIEQLERTKGKMPYKARLVKVKNYFSLE